MNNPTTDEKLTCEHPMTTDDQKPKLHIDSGWKAEAQAEKERLAQQEQKRQSDGGAQGQRGELPDADFRGLVGMLVSQAISGLGAMADQKTGRVVIDLEGSRFFIDLLGVLEEKTKGNLSDEEAGELTEVLGELQNRYVQITKLVAEQKIKPADDQSAINQPGQPGMGGMGGAPDLSV